MFRKFIAALVLVFFVMESTTFAATINGVKATDYLDNHELKAGDVISVTGIGLPPKNFDPNDSFAKTFARQVARMNALRELVETLESAVNRLDIRSTAVIENVVVKHDEIVSRISQDSKTFELLEKNTGQVGAARFLDYGNDISCEVDMEIILPSNWKEYFKK